MKLKDFLFTQQGKAYLAEEYERKERSTYDIAQERGTYANKIRRALLHHGFRLRDKGKAQEAALEAGRNAHPTMGKVRTLKEKQSISDGLAKSWVDMPPEVLEKRRERARQQWQEMSEEARQRLLTLAGEGMRRAAAEGSQMERHLLVGLQGAGYEAKHQAEFVISAEDMHVDILVLTPRVAIEVDGPSHHLPIWGDEQLAKTMLADNKKTGLLISAGYVVIRLKCLAKTVSDFQKRTALNGVLNVIRAVEAEFPPPERRLVELEVKATGEVKSDERQ